jgi:hypothetical protein
MSDGRSDPLSCYYGLTRLPATFAHAYSERPHHAGTEKGTDEPALWVDGRAEMEGAERP